MIYTIGYKEDTFLELLQLRYFRTAATLENFSKTAKLYMIPQSAVSKTIHKLEQELNCELFTRNGKNIKLNENGKLFLEKIDLALNSIDSAINELQPQELKTIGITIQSGVHFIPSLIEAYEKTHPNQKIVLFQEESNLLSEGDFTFSQLPIDEGLYNYKVLLTDEIMLAASKNSKFSKQAIISLAALKNENFISYPVNTLLRNYVEELCSNHGFIPHTIYEASNMSALRSMVEANLGLSLIPSVSWKMRESQHVLLIPLKEQPKRKLILKWEKNMTLTSEKQEFLDFAVNWFQNYQ